MTKEQSSGAESESLNLPLLAATSAALLTLVPVLAHQLGILSHLPDPPSRVFASDHITESSAAHPFGIPDGLLGIGSYGMTLTLALLAPDRPMARRLLAATDCGWIAGHRQRSSADYFFRKTLFLVHRDCLLYWRDAVRWQKGH